VNGTFLVDISSKYIFDRHAFYQMGLKIQTTERMQELGGNSIQIVPSRIPLASLRGYWDTIGPYLETLKANYTSQTTLEIDFIQKKVRLDGKEFTPDFISSN